jgi:hypothetical protein
MDKDGLETKYTPGDIISIDFSIDVENYMILSTTRRDGIIHYKMLELGTNKIYYEAYFNVDETWKTQLVC